MSRENLPIYEPFIQRHFPGWAASREAARTKSAAMASARGAISTRTGRGWGNNRSARMGTRGERFDKRKMMFRARQAYRDNPIARSLVEKETQYVAGNGFTLQAKAMNADGKPAEAFNKEAEDKWYRFLATADVRGMLTGEQLQQLGWKQPRIDGDGGFVLVGQGYESKLQYVPGDLISTPDGQWSNPAIFDGVEVDGAMRPIAFHIEDLDQDGKRTWKRIRAADFVFIAHLDNPLDARGSTAFQTIFDLLDQLDGYIDAVTIAARMGAIFGLIFKSENPAKEQSVLPGRASGSDGKEYRAITMESGMVKYVGKEGEVAQVNATQPMQQTPDFIRAIMRLVGLPFDMPLEITSQDLSQVSFAGGRMGLMGFYRACLNKEQGYKDRCWSRIYQWWISREVKLNKFTAEVPERYWDHELQGQERELNDRVKEAQADLLEMDMGVKSLQQIIAKRGGDFAEITAERALAHKALTDAGLPIPRSTYTRDTLQPGQTPPTVDPNSDPNADQNNDPSHPGDPSGDNSNANTNQ